MSRRAKQPASQPEILAHGDQGQLRTPSGHEWPVRVSELDGDVLMLVMLAQADELDGSSSGSPTLEATTRYGVARFRGEAVLEESDLVRFRVIDAPTVEQRREFVARARSTAGRARGIGQRVDRQRVRG